MIGFGRAQFSNVLNRWAKGSSNRPRAESDAADTSKPGARGSSNLLTLSDKNVRAFRGMVGGCQKIDADSALILDL